MHPARTVLARMKQIAGEIDSVRTEWLFSDTMPGLRAEPDAVLGSPELLKQEEELDMHNSTMQMRYENLERKFGVETEKLLALVGHEEKLLRKAAERQNWGLLEDRIAKAEHRIR